MVLFGDVSLLIYWEKSRIFFDFLANKPPTRKRSGHKGLSSPLFYVCEGNDPCPIRVSDA